MNIRILITAALLTSTGAHAQTATEQPSPMLMMMPMMAPMNGMMNPGAMMPMGQMPVPNTMMQPMGNMMMVPMQMMPPPANPAATPAPAK
ncbi:MAG: hypothetical protein ABL892_02430 [Thiobacillaceae bacterium]